MRSRDICKANPAGLGLSSVQRSLPRGCSALQCLSVLTALANRVFVVQSRGSSAILLASEQRPTLLDTHEGPQTCPIRRKLPK